MDKNILPPPDYDNQFKKLITAFFQQCIEFYLPQLMPLVDWAKGYEFLDNEIEQIRGDFEKEQKRITDKLAKVWLKDGSEKWVLIHLEVQSYFEKDFSKRMFIYYYRILETYNVDITALAIYVGDRIPKQFNKYEHAFVGTHIVYAFNTFVVRDWKNRKEELMDNENPFALATLACLYVMETKRNKNFDLRKNFKLQLARLCFERNYPKFKIYKLINFVWYIVSLPKNLQETFETEYHKIDNKNFPIMNYDGLDKGFQQFLEKKYYGRTVDEIIEEKELEIEERINKQVKARVKKQIKEQVKAQVREQQSEFLSQIEKSILNLHQEVKLDISTIAKCLELEESYVQKVIDEEQIEK